MGPSLFCACSVNFLVLFYKTLIFVPKIANIYLQHAMIGGYRMKDMAQALADAQLLALQNQIMPHYIANTLDAIRMRLILDGQTQTAELLRIFIDSLRTYTAGPRDTVTLREEVAFLDEYLMLQKFRRLDKLTWNIPIAQDLLELQIPRFILQPLVENSIRHGFAGNVEKPHLTLDAYRSGSSLFITLSDTGVGISPEYLQGGSLPATGVGYTNVIRRLQLLYGDDAGVHITSNPGAGTKAVVKIPLKGREKQ